MAVGCYGKYPVKRDYVAVNMPRPLLQPLENWLASALATSRDRLGRRWQEHYMVQPVWNFRLGRALTGTECLGAVAPSVDGVGRTFPLVILAYAPDATIRFSAEQADLTAWLALVHGRLMLALSDEPPLDPEALTAGLTDPPGAPLRVEPGIEPLGKGMRRLWGADGQPAADKALAALHGAQAGDHRSVWWTQGSALVPPQTASFDGWPDPEFMVAMMAGNATGEAANAAAAVV